MTLAEAAILLGLDPGTLRVQIHNGKLKARKVGPVWTVTPSEVERYRRESKRNGCDHEWMLEGITGTSWYYCRKCQRRSKERVA